jgi:hypothetical protein
VSVSCEHGNGWFDSTKFWVFLQYLRECWLLKKDSASLGYFGWVNEEEFAVLLSPFLLPSGVFMHASPMSPLAANIRCNGGFHSSYCM